MRINSLRSLYPATLLLLAGALALVAAADRRRPDRLARSLDEIPDRIGEWRCVGREALSEDVLNALKPTSYLVRDYVSLRGRIGLFVAYYAEQRAGESMHSPKNCLPGSGWEVFDYGPAKAAAAGRQVAINRYSVQKGGQRALVLYWYQSRGRVFASEYLGKLYLVRDALFDGIASGSIVRLTISDAPGALEDGEAFASAIMPEVQRCLGAPGR